MIHIRSIQTIPGGIRTAALSCALLAAAAASAPAQGRFSNFETPQTHPIDIARVNNVDYVLVCNTPDNSVDIFKAAPPHAFVERVSVGLGPGSVHWNAALGRFYTCNFDGDSVSVVRLDSAGISVHGVLERTANVGNEPADLAFNPTNTVLAVSLSSRSSITKLNPLDLSPAGGESRLIAADPALGAVAVKMPRRIVWLPDGRLFAANFRAGSPDPLTPPQYDLGLYRDDPFVSGGMPDFKGGLGSTNHSFAINSVGTLMFVVGTKAQNHGAKGVVNVSQLKTGFVQSWLMVVDLTLGGPWNVRPEVAAGLLPAPQLQSVNLNRDYSTNAVGLVEVPTAQALVQPTDVLLIENAGVVSKIVLTAFHSDRVAILTPSTTTYGGYSILQVSLPAASSYSVSGPRGLAYSAGNNLVYACEALDSGFSAIDPNTGAVTRIQLPNDPTPAEIRLGRQFLYSNRFSIDNSGTTAKGGFVSCAACHVDGRTDGLPWDLGSIATGAPVPPSFIESPITNLTNFPTEKGPLVTQTLQGLVNYPLNEEFQSIASNAPYHWRGDKADFTNFNEAFVNLQRMANISTPSDPKGISDADMIAYRRFINTILHPPNPEQDITRTLPGTLDPVDPNNVSPQATGAKFGALLFHDFPMIGSSPGRACVDCHSLPDGSSNTATCSFSVDKTLTPPGSQDQPFETAALRNIAQREMNLHHDFTTAVDQITGNSGLLHPGRPTFLDSASINRFIPAAFGFKMPDQNDKAREEQALVEFVRQLDTGTAPLAGFAYTVDPTLMPLDSGLNKTVFDIAEGQVGEANIGLGVYTRFGSAVRGFWFDTTLATPAYREEGTTNLLTRASLLALSVGAGNVVIAQGTPLGTERRWANPNGIATLISNPTLVPQNLVLESMAPNTAYVDIPKFTNVLTPGLPGTEPPTRSNRWTQVRMKQAVLTVPGGFGVPRVRHEPPRRFRVTGDNIRPGAKLLFAMAAGPGPHSTPVQIITMDLYPTTHYISGRQVWETLVELDVIQTLAMLCGGYWAPDVMAVLLRTTTTPALQPLQWNGFLIAVRNEDNSFGDSNIWQVLTVQDTR